MNNRSAVDGMSRKPCRKTLGDAVGARLWPLNGEQLCSAAQRRTGLKDFGEPSIDPALSVLVNSLQNEADLHPLGRFLISAHLREILETRLRLNQAWSENSE